MVRFPISKQAQQSLAVGLPLAALALSLGVVYPSWGRYQNLGKELATRANELAALRAAPLPQATAAQMAAADEPDESSRFVGDITLLAAGAGCEVTGLDVVPTEGKTGVARPKRAKVTIRGRYPNARSFLFRLANAPRVYVVADLQINANSGATQPTAAAPLSMTVTIERYVALPAFLAATPQSPERTLQR